MARALIPRQPYSEAVPSTGGRLHPLPFWKGRGLGSGLRTLPQGFLSPTRGTEGVVKTIEDRWGKYSTVGRFSSSSLRFLSPANGGTEGGVKTIEEDRDERWSLL